jgi:hypothetical protein
MQAGCPGVAASSGSPPHSAGLAAGHRSAAGDVARSTLFPVSICPAPCGARSAERSPPRADRAPRVVERTGTIAQTMRSGWLARAAFVFGKTAASCQLSAFGSRLPDISVGAAPHFGSLLRGDLPPARAPPTLNPPDFPRAMRQIKSADWGIVTRRN